MRLPFPGRRISSPFGRRTIRIPAQYKNGKLVRNAYTTTHDHNGFDQPAAVGEAYRAVAAGKVIGRGDPAYKTTTIGSYVILEHWINGRHMLSRYHMMETGSPIALGTEVDEGEAIGRTGQSGLASTGPHAHTEIWDVAKGVPIDGYAFITANAAAGGNSTPFPNQEEDDMYDKDAEYRMQQFIEQQINRVSGYVRRESRARWYKNGSTGEQMVAKITDGFLIDIQSDSQIASLKQNGYLLIASEEQPQMVDQLRWDNIRGEVLKHRRSLAEAVADVLQERGAK